MRSLIVNFAEHCNGYSHAYRGIEISVEVYKFPLASAFFPSLLMILRKDALILVSTKRNMLLMSTNAQNNKPLC